MVKKVVKIESDLHRWLRLKSFKEEKKIQEVVDEILRARFLEEGGVVNG